MHKLRNALRMLLILHVCAARRVKQDSALRHLQRRTVDAHKHCGVDFPCLNSTQCVPQDAICDGTPDCDNGSDEWEMEECRDLNLAKMWDDFFGTKDESGEEEEDDVNQGLSPDPLPQRSFDAHGHCGEDFPCINSTQCVPQEAICNGEPDCDNGSDEWELEECRDWNLAKMWDDFFGDKAEDEDVRREIPCEKGTFPESCDCFVEIEETRKDLPSLASPFNATGDASMGAGVDDVGTETNVTDGIPYGLGVQGVVVGVRLDCSARQLTEFPRNLPNKTISLDLSDNKITSLTKKDMEHLTHLRQLLLSRNKLQNVEEGTFESLTDLQTLRMIACDLEDVPPRMFATQNRLVTLDLSYNILTRLVRGSLFGLHNLEYLDIRGNRLAEIETGVFKDSSRIYFMHISQNRLSSIPAELFRPLRDLRSLNIHRNDISSIECGSFSTNTKLRDLNLGDNKLTEIKRGLFHNLTSVITLSLRNNSIRHFEEDAFAGMNNLQTLKLNQNPFTSVPIGIFDKLRSLKAIYFDHFSLCGYAPHVRLCMPKSDGISTAENLLANNLLRFAVWFVALLASLGNAFVLLARCFVKEDKKTHSFFIMNLAVADLLMGLYLLIIGIHDVIFRGVYILHDLAWRTSSVCKLSGFLSLLSSEVSIMTLTVITMDRFLSIVHPFRFKNRSLVHARLLMVLLWLLGVALATIPLLHTEYFGEFYYGGNGVCLPLQIDQPFANGWQFSLVIFVVFNLVAFAFISYAYLMMFVTIRRSNLAMRSTKKNQDWALVKRFTLIVATDFVCWMPIIIVKFVALGGVSVSNSVYAWFAIFVLPINSALNPILYTMTTVLFKQKVLAPLGIVRAKRKKGYLTGISVDDTSTMSKNSGTRLSIISTKSRGGSVNGRFSSHKKLKNFDSLDSSDESVICTATKTTTKKRAVTVEYHQLPVSDSDERPLASTVT
ncbi:relaxin receptor 2-like isoform X1 [Patiria miniata]|uniref:G-protein coupled receptors family 1 profile domain-containing protein n=1 Tax=Patiria miniata TaxID=46514 RepID=A0A914A733_PATMI|nr:relaxin receptor 2-like isoform X1 [Patiria miniata]